MRQGGLADILKDWEIWMCDNWEGQRAPGWSLRADYLWLSI